MSMFLVYSAAGHSDPPHLPQETNIEQCLELLDSNADFPTHRSVQLALPVANLRDPGGDLTPSGESFFLLLARRMKSLSLSVSLTSSSPSDTAFTATIAARMMRETPLESTQLCLSADGQETSARTLADPVLTITITRQDTIAGDNK